jgi:RimJ/RimL family protein N-acetyltransferase
MTRMSPLPTLSASEITADRLVLRKAHEDDRDGLIELLTEEESRAYLGGPRPDQPVRVVTRTANRRSLKLATRLGFRHFGTFEEFGAEQSLATARLHTFKD